MGQQTGFIRRKKVLSALDFLALMTIGQMGMKHPSLAAMVETFKGRISREGIHRRFSASAVAFMKSCAQFVLKQRASEIIHLHSTILQHFKRILIFDSTSWGINPILSGVLPGSGGNASAANCKVQVCYEYKSGELSFFEIQPGSVPDNVYTANVPKHLQRGDLLLVDLGYFSLNAFCQIVSRGAFFLSRLLVATKLICPETLKPIDLLAVLKKIPGDVHQMQVLMGSLPKNRVLCRLICLRVSEDVANERRRKLRKRAKEKGTTPSQYHSCMAEWTLMVTNVPQYCISAEMVRPFYTLRWQIELLFKQIKMVLCIHKSNTGKENRLLCEVYGKLIMAVMIHRIHADINIRLWNNKRRELSMEKLYKRLQERAFIILHLLHQSLKKAIDYLQDEIPRLIKNCLKCHQRFRRSTLEVIEYGLAVQNGETTMLIAA